MLWVLVIILLGWKKNNTLSRVKYVHVPLLMPKVAMFSSILVHNVEILNFLHDYNNLEWQIYKQKLIKKENIHIHIQELYHKNSGTK